MSEFKNYQLYRTNTKLGGQIQWDLVLGNVGNDLVVTEFHLTPISKNIPFISNKDEDLLKYSHQYNIQKFYERTQGYFYNACSNSEFLHEWPIIYEEHDRITSCDNTLELGTSRSTYKLYNKQFNSLVPVWLENVDGNLGFIINIYSVKSDETNKIINRKLISSKTLNLNQIEGYQYHNKFVSYFENYIKYVGLYPDGTGSDLVKISLLNKTAQICGLKVDSGIINTININDLTSNLLYRERPLMEVDSLIINSFSNNNMISKQLFNFNLNFNANDIISDVVLNSMLGQKIEIEVLVEMNSSLLKIKDFYTNYDTINRTIIQDSKSESQFDISVPNVFDYLNDNKYVKYQNINKFSPNIIHWSLLGNNEYLFNLYNGFGSYYIDNEEIKLGSNFYDDSPSLTKLNYEKFANNLNWCNYSLDKWDIKDYRKFIQDFKVENFIKIGGEWTKNVKYLAEFDPEPTESEQLSKNLYIYCACANNDLWKYLKNGGFSGGPNYYLISLPDSSDKKFYIIPLEHYSTYNRILFISENKDSITFASFSEIIKNGIFESDPEEYIIKLLKALSDYMESKLVPNSYNFTKGLLIDRAPSPSLSSKEIEYYKQDEQFSQYVTRYDGYLTPTFIDSSSDITNPNRYFNYYFHKQKYIKSNIPSVYNEYSKSNYNPEYPSIGYYSISSNIVNYEDDIPDEMLFNVPEYKWFNRSLNMILLDEINLVLKNQFENTDDLSIKPLIISKLLEIYPEIDPEYVYSLYDISINTEYDYSKTDPIRNQYYIYNVNLNLK